MDVTPLDSAVFAACSWEAVTLATGKRRLTISRVCYRHPLLTPLIVGGLTAHLLGPLLHIRRAGKP